MSSCSHCKEQTHRTSHCPQLYDALKEGFFTGGGSHSHSNSDDDEKAQPNLGIHHINGSHCNWIPLLYCYFQDKAHKMPLTPV
jgi:hypothetical protein